MLKSKIAFTAFLWTTDWASCPVVKLLVDSKFNLGAKTSGVLSKSLFVDAVDSNQIPVKTIPGNISNIFLGTWNLGNVKLEEVKTQDLEEFLLLSSGNRSDHDMYVVSIQEAPVLQSFRHNPLTRTYHKVTVPVLEVFKADPDIDAHAGSTRALLDMIRDVLIASKPFNYQNPDITQHREWDYYANSYNGTVIAAFFSTNSTRKCCERTVGWTGYGGFAH